MGVGTGKSEGSKRTQFKKGQGGNRKGRKPRSAEQTTLELWKKTFDAKAMGGILATLLKKAQKGEPWAIREVLDRMAPIAYMAEQMTGDKGADNPIVEAFKALMESKKEGKQDEST